MSLSMSGEAHLGPVKSRATSSSIVIVTLLAVLVALCTANGFFLRASDPAVAATGASFSAGP